MARRDRLHRAQNPAGETGGNCGAPGGPPENPPPEKGGWVMNRKQILVVTAIGLALAATWPLESGVVLGQPQQSIQVPKFQYDPSFPQPLPEKWAIGAIGGMAVDSHDNVWVLHRPGPLQKNERFAGAGMR